MHISHFLWFILKIYAQKVLFTQTQLKKIGLRKKINGFRTLSSKSTFLFKTTKTKHLSPKNKQSGPKRPSIAAAIVP